MNNNIKSKNINNNNNNYKKIQNETEEHNNQQDEKDNENESEVPLITLYFLSIYHCCKNQFNRTKNIPYLF